MSDLEAIKKWIKEKRKCNCDAKWSGIDEVEYAFLGCPSCICDFRALDALEIALEELNEHHVNQACFDPDGYNNTCYSCQTVKAIRERLELKEGE